MQLKGSIRVTDQPRQIYGGWGGEENIGGHNIALPNTYFTPIVIFSINYYCTTLKTNYNTIKHI